MLGDLFERILYGFVALLVLATLALCGLLVWAKFNEIEGEVTSKYYDDPDLVCGKVCVPVDECWTVEVAGNPWWDDTLCYTKSDWDKIEVGNYVEEN
jgi:hypothetical protein